MIVTIEEVEIYRDIYYEHFKPECRRRGVWGMSDAEAQEVLAPALAKHGWSMDKYQAFCQIDFMQRLVKHKSNHLLEHGTPAPIEIRYTDGPDEPLDSLTLSLIPELKCPRRTTQTW